MTQIKSFTDIEQSTKLAEILPIESADMYWWYSGRRYYIEAMNDGDFNENSDIRAWSLAALMYILESEIDGEEGETYQLNIEKDGTWWNVWYREQYDAANPIETKSTEELIDACYELIIKLNEQKLL